MTNQVTNYIWPLKIVKGMGYSLNYSGTSFCPLRIKITQLPGGYRNEYVTLSDFKLILLVREFGHTD